MRNDNSENDKNTGKQCDKIMAKSKNRIKAKCEKRDDKMAENWHKIYLYARA